MQAGYSHECDARIFRSERVGSECAGCDVPFFLEIVPYQDGMDDKSPQFAQCKPAILTNAMQEFSDRNASARNAPAVTSLSSWKLFRTKTGWMIKVLNSRNASRLFSRMRCKNFQIGTRRLGMRRL